MTHDGMFVQSGQATNSLHLTRLDDMLPATSPDFSDAPLILTLQVAEPVQSWLEDQRQRYFPPERNMIPAHLTLFHHLPGRELNHIASTVEQAAHPISEFPVDIIGLRSLGHGVAYKIVSPVLEQLRAGLADRFSQWLTTQDRQKFSPHITIQNKVTNDQAANLLYTLTTQFEQRQTTGHALLLWRYLNGPWQLESRFPFGYFE